MFSIGIQALRSYAMIAIYLNKMNAVLDWLKPRVCASFRRGLWITGS